MHFQLLSLTKPWLEESIRPPGWFIVLSTSTAITLAPCGRSKVRGTSAAAVAYGVPSTHRAQLSSQSTVTVCANKNMKKQLKFITCLNVQIIEPRIEDTFMCYLYEWNDKFRLNKQTSIILNEYSNIKVKTVLAYLLSTKQIRSFIISIITHSDPHGNVVDVFVCRPPWHVSDIVVLVKVSIRPQAVIVSWFLPVLISHPRVLDCTYAFPREIGLYSMVRWPNKTTGKWFSVNINWNNLCPSRNVNCKTYFYCFRAISRYSI